MKVLREKVKTAAKTAAVILLFCGWASAPQKSPELGLCSIKESAAYRQYLNRPACEYSKVIYLIERFKNLPYEVVYDGMHYKIKNVAGIVGAFLRFNYKKDCSAKDWVLKYANRSVVRNELILLKLDNGKTYRAGEILLQELENLERAIAEPRFGKDVLTDHLPVKIENPALKTDALPLAPAN